MSKTVAYLLGVLTGAAGGSVATYYIYKNIRDEEQAQDEADMEDYYKSRYCKPVEKTESENLPEEKIEQNSVDAEDDREKIRSNEGVKKYHHDNGLESAYGSARIFGEDAKPVVKKEKKVIREISEQEFLNAENGYQKQTVDVFMSNDDEEPEIYGIWAYETDNEEPVDKKFGKSTSELLDGRTYEDLLRYCIDVNSEGNEIENTIGALYLKNDDLKINFEFVIHNN